MLQTTSAPALDLTGRRCIFHPAPEADLSIYQERAGKPCVVEARTRDELSDLGPLYRARFEDGETLHLFASELHPID
jgi:hypothetical protein